MARASSEQGAMVSRIRLQLGEASPGLNLGNHQVSWQILALQEIPLSA